MATHMCVMAWPPFFLEQTRPNFTRCINKELELLDQGPFMSHYDKQQVDILMLIVIIGAMLSLCGSLFIMISSVLLAKVKEIYWRLVFGLATSDLLMIAFGVP